MSIKSEKFPEAFEELFERFDSPDRDKKDVAFLVLGEVEKKYKTLKAKNLLLFQRYSALQDSRDELLDFLKRVDQENWLDGDWWADITPLIEKTEKLKEKETK